ncbi:hypothetical protein GDO86_010211 [Hymenochirus boettgeri]|uniref:Cadherin domain-containing protein n=1 Tax=Hymenochirus boettgeri TaxID=247094 RepID=A0A8T2JPP2_9PIPI|nr:hypothetical protein GDO86_010211 [Hymenochirus boettgeri]
MDEDCSPQYSQICNYEISTSNVPFAIDRNGNIRNTEKLSYDKQHQYEIKVTAYDCGQKHAAEEVTVIVDIKPVCKPGWQDWERRIEYNPGSGSVALFPNVRLETCDGPVSFIRTSIELQMNRVGKGCDRETYFDTSLKTVCGAIDLLPSPSASTNWTAGLPMDNSGMIFKFDGKQGVKIPDAIVPKNLTDQFTITMWMKHGPSPGLRAEKETILCNSDKTEMNRHHYALYVHNCRLVFLLRRDFDQADTFRPAEFHWKLDQICDKEWHYYIINIDFPLVTLYMDGATYEPYLVTNDWPIHPSHIAMQLTVGACWQGGEITKPKFAQYFRGSIAGLMLRPGKIESQKMISCLQACKEGLDINSLENLGQGVKYHFNPSQSALVMEGEDIDSINQALRRVSYINSQQIPSAGKRHLKVSSKVQCFGEDICITIPDIDAYVTVLQTNEPKITVTGMDHFARPASEFENSNGVILLPDIRIISTVTKMEKRLSKNLGKTNAPVMVEEVLHRLEFCDILVTGEELDITKECLELDINVLQGKYLKATNSTKGYSIYGSGTMQSYEDVLHQIRYRYWDSASIFGRKFKVKCSELNGRYTSNEFNLEVNILHNSNFMENVNHMVIQPEFMPSLQHPNTELSRHETRVSPGATAIVLVACVSILVIIVVLGILRLRAVHQQDFQDKESVKENEINWDDSALTITVNPMEKYETHETEEYESEGEDEEENDEEEDEEEEEESTSGESEESDDEEMESQVKAKQHNATRRGLLEWNHHTITY